MYGSNNEVMISFNCSRLKALVTNQHIYYCKGELNVMSIINENLIKLNISNNSKEEVIKTLANLINNENRLNDYDSYVEEVLYRENIITTGIGNGIAIPHGKCKAVKVPTIAVGRINEGVEWDSLDDKPVNIVFLLAIPEEYVSDKHLRILASLCRKLMHEQFVQELFNSDNEEILLTLLLE
jgi:fructose-specific phosphotransferase system IIA component